MVANPSASRNEPVAGAFLVLMGEAERAALVAAGLQMLIGLLFSGRNGADLTAAEIDGQARALARAIASRAPLIFAGERVSWLSAVTPLGAQP